MAKSRPMIGNWMLEGGNRTDGKRAAGRATRMGYKIIRGKSVFNGKGYTPDPNGWGISGKGIDVRNIHVDVLAEMIDRLWESR